MFCVEQSLAFAQCDDFLSIADKLAVSLNEKLLNSSYLTCSVGTGILHFVRILHF